MSKGKRNSRLPVPFRLLNGGLACAGVRRWGRFRFDEELLTDLASERTGLSDFGGGLFREGFEVLLRSAREDLHLHPLGHLGIHGMLVTVLSNRLEFIDAVKKNEDSRSELSAPPLIILGLPRSGTTFLHRLLAVDESFQTLPFWQAMRPFPPPNREDNRKSEAARTLAIRRRMTPELDRKHFVRVDSPEECIWPMNLTLASHGFWVSAPFSSYLEWLSRVDRTPAYREYRDVLRCLQFDRPGNRFLLKAPSHSGSLHEIWKTFPEAQVIQTHRDPVAVVASFNSLFYSVHSAVEYHVDSRRLGAANLRMLRNETERNLEARQFKPGRVLDVEFEEIQSDPLAAVRRIRQSLGLDWPPELELATAAFIDRNPRGRHGRHSYRLDDFGLTEETVRSELGWYREALGLGST